MRWSVPPDHATVKEFALRLEAHDPLIVCEALEEVFVDPAREGSEA